MAQAEAVKTPDPSPSPQQPLGNERKWTHFFTFSTDHKVIGIQYLVTSFVFYLSAGDGDSYGVGHTGPGFYYS